METLMKVALVFVCNVIGAFTAQSIFVWAERKSRVKRSPKV